MVMLLNRYKYCNECSDFYFDKDDNKQLHMHQKPLVLNKALQMVSRLR